MCKAAEGVGGVGMGTGQEVAPGAVSCEQRVRDLAQRWREGEGAVFVVRHIT